MARKGHLLAAGHSHPLQSAALERTDITWTIQCSRPASTRHHGASLPFCGRGTQIRCIRTVDCREQDALAFLSTFFLTALLPLFCLFCVAYVPTRFEAHRYRRHHKSEVHARKVPFSMEFTRPRQADPKYLCSGLGYNIGSTMRIPLSDTHDPTGL